MNFIRWNSTSKLYEISTDAGGSWATLDLDAAQITSGTFNASRIPSLDASKITTGELDAARLPDITNAMVDAAAAIAWSKINKSGSSIADLGTRSASDINAGTLGASLYPDFIASGASHAKGAVPDPGATGGTTKFLREDATWVAPNVGKGCRLTHSGNQNIATGTSFSAPALDTEIFDDDTMHDTVTNSNRITIKTAGVYHLHAFFYGQILTSGQAWHLQLNANAGTIIANTVAVNNNVNNSYLDVSALYRFAVNEYVDMEVKHGYSGNRIIYAASSYGPLFEAYRLGD